MQHGHAFDMYHWSSQPQWQGLMKNLGLRPQYCKINQWVSDHQDFGLTLHLRSHIHCRKFPSGQHTIVEPLHYGPWNWGHLHYTDGRLRSQTITRRNTHSLHLCSKDTSPCYTDTRYMFVGCSLIINGQSTSCWNYWYNLTVWKCHLLCAVITMMADEIRKCWRKGDIPRPAHGAWFSLKCISDSQQRCTAESPQIMRAYLHALLFLLDFDQ